MRPWPADPAGDGITDRPSPPVPPWELPGNFRRDCEPHRAGLLQALALLSAGTGVVALVEVAILSNGAHPLPQPGGRVAGPLAAEGRVIGGAHRRREPDAPPLVQHRAVDAAQP